MIKLKDFISETLSEIVEGVVEAQGRVLRFGAQVSPVHRGHPHGPRVESVEFDIQVATSDASKTKQGVGVFVVSLGAGIQGQTDATQSSAGRIRFHVWLELPDPKPAASASVPG